jgi:hypothetical protein
MSPTQFAVRAAAIERQLAVARRAGDIPRMQHLIGQHQRLLELVYGKLA